MMSSFEPSGASVASVTDRVLKGEVKAPATAVHFIGDVAACVSGEESVVLVDGAGAGTEVAVHGGGILCSVSDGRRLVTGGDDGKVVVVDAKGKIETLAADARHRWIDNVAVHADGSVAWSAGKTAFVKTKDAEKSFDAPSTVGGLAFAPKGLRLAIAHYNGVTLWFPNMAAKPEVLE